MMKKPKFLLLGWDSADWKVINPLIDAGLMPALEGLVNRGVMGNIATLDPPLSPMLWTSIATGKYAFKHGVHGFLEFTDNNTKVRAVTNESIKTNTLWEILNKNGYKTNVVGWWPSHPAKKIDGVQVSNFFGKVNPKSVWHRWEKFPNSICPLEFEEVLNKFRVHPGELGLHQLSSFIPDFGLLKEEDQDLVNLILTDLAECLSIHSAATYLAEHTEWDFMAVYYNAIDHISHSFMKFHPPRLPWIPEDKFELFQHVIKGAYRLHDLMLARWLDLVGPDCHVMVLSDHGFHSDHLRVRALPKEPAAIAREHNYLGMMAICGPNIKKDERFYGSSLLDICPTILSIFDVAIGKDFDGKVLTDIFELEPKLSFKETWDGGQKNRQVPQSLSDSEELIQQLVDLGYVDDTNFESPVEIKRLRDENNYYLARAYFDATKLQEAKIIMRSLCKERPKNDRYVIFYGKIAAELKDEDSLKEAITSLEAMDQKGSKNLVLLKGKLSFIQNDFTQALSYFKSLSKSRELNSINIEYQIANTLLKMHKYEDALKNFEKVLDVNPDGANAMHGAGVCYIGLNNFEKAIDFLIDSVGVTYFNPSAHFHLGIAFKGIQAYREAEQAFLIAKQLAPRMSRANSELIELYKLHLHEPQKIAALKEDLERKSKGTIYIVSGLPRSGTSMMMQMLEAGGAPIFSDNIRQADSSNPRGYYEHEKIKSLASDSHIITQANGKVVKVITPLLKFLPSRFNYKVILMTRAIRDVLSSQEEMIKKEKGLKEVIAVFEMDKILKKSYQDALTLMNNRVNFDYIEMSYEQIIDHPDEPINDLNTFLGLSLNKKSMQKIIDKSLQRNKK
jgi:predicted AlkP superfamily phosphohydrolase/phosphomutase/tetratricopeptide (TPR) repeat protein